MIEKSVLYLITAGFLAGLAAGLATGLGALALLVKKARDRLLDAMLDLPVEWRALLYFIPAGEFFIDGNSACNFNCGCTLANLFAI